LEYENWPLAVIFGRLRVCEQSREVGGIGVAVAQDGDDRVGTIFQAASDPRQPGSVTGKFFQRDGGGVAAAEVEQASHGRVGCHHTGIDGVSEE
jgi:hypothetical protein